MRTKLQEFFNVLELENRRLCELKNKYIFTQIELLRTCINDHCTDDNSVLKEMNFSIPTKPPKTFPEEIKDIVVSLEIEVKFSAQNEEIRNPLKSIDTFNVIVKGDESLGMHSWHLDGDSSGDSNKYLHPFYHITFGGEKMENSIPEWDFGKFLLMRAPRFMHPPMDIILGIDFILNHYVAKEYSEFFLENESYKKIVNEMKKSLWKPYALAFAKNFCSSLIEGDQKLEFDHSFCSSIIGK